MTSYRVRVAVGAALDTVYDITDESDADYGLADPVTITRTIPNVGDLWPVQPAPAEATFAVIAEAFIDIVDLYDIGHPVTIDYYSPSDALEPLESFAGRITDLVPTPHPLGILLNVNCVDYLADLAEYPVPEAIAGSGGSNVDIVRNGLTYYSGLGAAAVDHFYPQGTYPTTPGTGSLSVWHPDTTDLAEAFERILAGCIFTYNTGDAPPDFPDDPARFRLVLIPNIVDGLLDDTTKFWEYPLFRQSAIPELILAAGTVDRRGSYSLRKGDRVDRVSLTYRDPDGTIQSGVASNVGSFGLPAAQLVTDVVGFTAFAAAVNFYLPLDVADAWVAEGFTWRLYAEDDGTYLNAIDDGARFYLGQLVTIDGVDVRWTPSGTDTYSGVLGGYKLTIAKGKPTLDLELRRPLDAAP